MTQSSGTKLDQEDFLTPESQCCRVERTRPIYRPRLSMSAVSPEIIYLIILFIFHKMLTIATFSSQGPPEEYNQQDNCVCVYWRGGRRGIRISSQEYGGLQVLISRAGQWAGNLGRISMLRSWGSTFISRKPHFCSQSVQLIVWGPL